ncbi:MAG: type II secretion system protein [Planctomycetota bacterium]|jgi:prepilin-type N-terminal cleavage/methylation domain-containing protein/prepilin-type processing-associated H-X9-DG protein
MIARPRREAFSLLELVAVLAVIAVLLGLMLPALAGVRKSSRTALCVSNLRQMAIAAQRYALEFQYFPPALRYENEGTMTEIGWDWVTTWGGQVISPGPLWEFTDDPGKVQQCPEYHGTTNTADPYTGYNYNTTYIGGEGSWQKPGWAEFRAGVRYSACRWTARVAMFGDGGRAGSTNKYMRGPMNTEGHPPGVIYTGGQAFRHQKATIVAYLDGHVGSARTPFRGGLATEALLNDAMDYPRNGFLSDDDRAYDPR